MPDEPAPEEAAAPPAAAAAPPASNAPWTNDLASLVTDDAARANVDRYLRETWQPRVTQLEQQYAETEAARALHHDFVDNPQDTFLSVGEQLFGEDFAQQLQGLYGSGEEQPPEAAAAAPPEPPREDPEVAEMKAEWLAQKQQSAYEQLLTQAKESHADVEIVDELFHPFVIAADGDFDAAVGSYKNWVARAQSAGVTPGQPPPATPPTTLGTQVDGSVPIPVTPKYESLDAALDDTLAEMRANRVAATVGSV